MMTDTAVQLTCEQCKRRKTKCDKQSPCSACRAAGLGCHPVQRARLPRGRTGRIKKRNIALEDKVARLEGLLHRIESQINEEGKAIESDNDVGAIAEAQIGGKSLQYTNKVEKFVARDFWTALSNEVSGLRETLEESDEEESSQSIAPVVATSSTNQQASLHSLLFQHGGTVNYQTKISSLPTSARHVLLELYKNRVDVLFKILHWPTFLNMVAGKHNTNTTAAKALENAVYFLALCSTTPEDCEHFRLGDRAELLDQARHAVEISLSDAQLLVTNDVIVLQAFVLYLTAIRCCMSASITWTLVALAIRIASTCGVGSENVHCLTPFEFEQRRRLWFGIGLLDSQTAFGRGSLPLLSHRDLTPPPLVINDSEMSPEHVQTTSDSSFTDMTFSSLGHHAMICQRKLCDPSIAKWQDRVDVVVSFELFVNQNYGQFEFSEKPLQRYTAYGARDMAASMNLLLRRPPYKHVGDPVPEDDQFDVLSMACRILQSGLFKRAEKDFIPYSWFVWPRWYALAVVLVELLNGQKRPAYEHAVAVAEKSYADYAQSASDIHSGLLWKPIDKLMRRLRQQRGAASSSTTNVMHHRQLPPSELPHSTGNVDRGDRPVSVSANLGAFDYAGSFKVPPMLGCGSLDQNVETPWLQWDAFLDDVSNTVGNTEFIYG